MEKLSEQPKKNTSARVLTQQDLNLELKSYQSLTLTVQKAIAEKLNQKPKNIIFNVSAKEHDFYVAKTLNFSLQTTVQNQRQLTQIFYFCKFKNIKRLHIVSGQIQNCEFLNYLDTPCLADLFRSNNRITCLKAMVKSNLPSIKILNITKNLTKNLSLDRLKLPQMTQSLVLQFSDQGYIVPEDLCNLVKLEPRFYKRIRIQSNQRIFQEKIRQKLEERFICQEKSFRSARQKNYVRLL